MTPVQPTQDGPSPVKNGGNRSRTIWLFTSLLLLAAVLWFFYWLFYLQYHQWTDDAYANGNFVNINPAVSGSVVAYFVDDTDLVKEGQLLVSLDTTEYQAQFDKELATLASVVLQVKQLYSNVEASRANFEAKKIAFERANYDYENRVKLVGSLAISNEEFIHSKDELESAKYNLKQAEFNYQSALDAVGKEVFEKHPLIEKQKGNVRTAYYTLQHCSIYAPVTGYVAQRNVEVGQWVTPNSNLMAILPTDYVWVDANYKETQLTYMRIGQPAKVTFDLYGSGVEFEGRVLGIASGTGSVFSLIPPQNATGNWIKIVQRLPVRISLDPKQLKEYPPRLGISAEVDVDITNQDLPRLAQVPPTRPVATTKVFDIQMEKIDLLMNKMIRQIQEEI